MLTKNSFVSAGIRCVKVLVLLYGGSPSGGARILEQVGPAAGPKVVW